MSELLPFGTTPPRVALLVDGENMSVALAGAAIMRSLKFGALTIRRVYGNAAKMPGWDAAPGFRLVHAGVGKNATDVLLAVEAMAIMLLGQADVLIIATSDGDFRHVACALRESGRVVIGMGEGKAPDSFRKACNQFIQIDATMAVAAQPHLHGQAALSVLDRALTDVLPAGGLSMSQCVSLLRARADLAEVLPKNGAGSYIRQESRVAMVTGQGSNLAIRLKQP
jgi:NYN domain